MNKKTWSVLSIVISCVLVFSPGLVFAQSSSNNDEGRSEWNGEERQRISNWRRQNSETRRKINKLDDDAVLAIPVPVLGLVRSSITSDFGDPRGGGTRSHEGQDILAPRGTPVLSPTEAVVLRVGKGTNSGNNVYTANPGDETFVYMHLDSIAKGLDSGDEIEKGEIIGYVGNTGNASGGPTHLHFEIQEDGDAKDPYPRLTGTFSSEEISGALKETGTSAETQTGGTVSSGGTFTRDLEFGAVGEDVRILQKFLNTHGFIVASSGAGSPGNETTYFGSATKAALIKFQAAHSVSPTAGYFGPKTRAAFAAAV